MRFYVVALCLLLGTGFSSLVSAKNAATAKPTAAPLMTSTSRPASDAPTKVVARPTKAMIINAPPKAPEKKMERLQAAESKPKETMLKEPAPMAAPPMATAMKTEATKTETLKADFKVTDAKPVQVTGFITKNGNIYEVEGKDGIGLIEGRQSPDEKDTHICNYGSVVLYSDVPCEQVTNVHVGEVQHHTIKERPHQEPEAQPQQQDNEAPAEQQQEQSIDEENTPLSDAESDDDLQDFSERPNAAQKRRRNNKNQNRRRQGQGQNNPSRRRKNQNRRNGNGGNRNQRPYRNQQQRQQQRRRNQNRTKNQRRRQQQQQQQRRRKNQNQGNRNGQWQQQHANRFPADDYEE